MSLADLLKRGNLRGLATATSATPATFRPHFHLNVATVATVAVAEALDPAANDPSPDPDRWCWPFSSAMNGAEINLMIMRLDHLEHIGIANAEGVEIADKLMKRNREGDERHICIECRHRRVGPRCIQRLPVLDVLQRCDYFEMHPDLRGTNK